MTKHPPLRTVQISICSLAVLLSAFQALAQSDAPATGEATQAAEPAAPPPSEPSPEMALPPEEPAVATEPGLDAAAPPPPDAPKPPPYSLPFQLRPAAAVTVVRSDTSFAFYENPANGNSGSTAVSMLLGSYKVTEEFAPLVRVGLVSNLPPEAEPEPKDGFGFLNPVVGAAYAPKLDPHIKVAFFLGFALPVGSGGGNDPDPGNVLANSVGMAARSAMDNAMFAVNDFTIFPGVGLAYVNHGFTAQVEATVLQLMRVRGEDVQKDEQKTNFTTGLHLGYFLLPSLSIGAELRHQRFISTPAAVEADEAEGGPNLGIRDNTTVAIGPRFHFKVAEKTWMRPAVSFSAPLDDPMQDRKYKIVQLDIPVVF